MKIPSISSNFFSNPMEAKLVNSGSTNSLVNESGVMPYESTALVVARMISRTLILVTIIICSVVLLSSYIGRPVVQQCDHAYDHSEARPIFEPLTSEPSEEQMSNIPISIRMNGRAADLMNVGQGQQGRVNCLVERKVANQLIASEPKKLNTPFGNITTDPRLIQLTGEKLHFSCGPPGSENASNEENDDGEDGPARPEVRPVPLIIIARRRPIMPIDGAMDSANETNTNPDQQPIPVPLLNRSKREANSDKQCSCSCKCDKEQ